MGEGPRPFGEGPLRDFHQRTVPKQRRREPAWVLGIVAVAWLLFLVWLLWGVRI